MHTTTYPEQLAPSKPPKEGPSYSIDKQMRDWSLKAAGAILMVMIGSWSAWVTSSVQFLMKEQSRLEAKFDVLNERTQAINAKIDILIGLTRRGEVPTVDNRRPHPSDMR